MYKRTVLIVEDEFLIRLVLADTLVNGGYHVVEAGNVLEAVAILGQQKIDAVITDVDMPGGLSGLDLAKMIATTRLDLPVMIVSGRLFLTDDELPGNAVFVPKPYRVDAIVAMVGEMTTRLGPRRTA